MNGISSNPQQQQQQSLLQAQAHAAHSAAVFRSPAPSNPPRPNSAAYSLGTNPDHLSSQTQGSADPPSTLPTSSIDGANPGAAGPRSAGAMVPQTPAQQVLYSPADRFGLLGLLQIIKHADPDTSKLTLGMDLTQLGLDLGSNKCVDDFAQMRCDTDRLGPFQHAVFELHDPLGGSASGRCRQRRTRVPSAVVLQRLAHAGAAQDCQLP